MKCPACQQEMVPGLLRSWDLGDLFFVPDDAEETRVTVKKNMVFRSLNFQRKGFVCKACEVILFDYKNTKT